MKTEIKKQNLNDEYYTDEKCYITELSNDKNDEAASIARARVEPGVTTRWHCLRDTVERYVILSGIGLVEAGNLPAKQVTSGDVVLIPPMCRQRIHNVGKEDLLFLAICTPRFRQDVYEDLENNP